MDSYRNPAARWRGSPNFTPDRAGHDMTQPAWIVLHTMDGSLAGADARFQQAGQQASATYGIGLDGSLVQWVDEKDAAWANDSTGAGGKGDNLDSVSIEHEDDGDVEGPRTPALYRASALLVRDLCARYAVPCDRTHVIGHRECVVDPATGQTAPTSCPDGLDVDRIVGMAAGTIPLPGGETDMLLVDVGQGPNGENPGIWLLSGGLYAHVASDQATAAYAKVNVPTVSVTYEDHVELLAAAARGGTPAAALAGSGSFTFKTGG